MSLATYSVKRILLIPPQILLVIVLAFVLIHAMPGDPIVALVGESGASPDYMKHIRQVYGLDQPMYIQFFIYLSRIIQGDLGYSFVYNMPVLDLIFSRIPATVLLVSSAVLFSTVFGILLGIVSGVKRRSAADYVTTLLYLFGYSMPTFWLGIILLLVFALGVGLFPVGGMASVGMGLSGISYVLDVLRHLVLPTLTLGFFQLALVTRLCKSKMVEVMTSDYIVTARAKGLPDRKIIFDHGLRNALIPVITITGINLGMMFSGAVVTEIVFAWPGLGRLIYDSMLSLDYPTLLGTFMFMSIMIVITTFLTDLIYSVVDPRIRYGPKK